jgi:uncharacterized membrane protein YqiK
VARVSRWPGGRLPRAAAFAGAAVLGLACNDSASEGPTNVPEVEVHPDPGAPTAAEAELAAQDALRAAREQAALEEKTDREAAEGEAAEEAAAAAQANAEAEAEAQRQQAEAEQQAREQERRRLRRERRLTQEVEPDFVSPMPYGAPPARERIA